MEENNLSLEELENLEEVKLEIGESAFEVEESVCNECGGNLERITENRHALGGAITFHITKLRCKECGKEYLDLSQAERYDFLLMLEKALKQKQALKILSKKLALLD